MGFGLPAAMGAAVGCPDQLVCCIAGDGSVQMNAQELATCAQNADPDQGVHHEQRLPRAWSASGRSCSGTANTATSTWASSPTSSSSPRPTARPGMRFEDKTTLVEDMKRAIATDGPGARRRARDARGEHLPDDPRRAGRARDGGVSAWVNREPRSRSASRSSRRPPNLRTGRKHVLSILVENKSGVLTRIAGPVRAARLQHRHADGRPDRGRADLARDAHRRRRAAPDRPGHQAAAQARQRAEDPRSRAGRHGRARAGAVQGLRRRRRSAAS